MHIKYILYLGTAILHPHQHMTLWYMHTVLTEHRKACPGCTGRGSASCPSPGPRPPPRGTSRPPPGTIPPRCRAPCRWRVGTGLWIGDVSTVGIVVYNKIDCGRNISSSIIYGSIIVQ